METVYGYSQVRWDEAIEEARQILIRVASQQTTIPYSELSKQIRAISVAPHDSAMAVLLGEISAEEDAAGRGMLSVLVVHKEGDQRPGPGFFKFAQTLGRDVSNPDAFWIAELNRVYGAYKNSR